MKKLYPKVRDTLLIVCFTVFLTMILLFCIGILDRSLSRWIKQNTVFHLTTQAETLTEENFKEGKYLIPNSEKVRFFVVKNGEILVEYYYSTDAFGRRRSHEPKGQKNERRAALIFGDSFAFGFGSNDEDTLSSWINKSQSQIVAYNYGIIGASPRETYIITKNRDILKEVKEPIGYLIYVYISGQYQRLSKFHNDGLPVLRLENGAIVENWERNPFLVPFHLFSQSRLFYLLPNSLRDLFLDSNNEELFCSLLEKSWKHLAQKNSNVQLIILNYDPWGHDTASEQNLKNCAEKLQAKLVVSPSRKNPEDFYPIDEHPRPLTNKKTAEHLLKYLMNP